MSHPPLLERVLDFASKKKKKGGIRLPMHWLDEDKVISMVRKSFIILVLMKQVA